MRKHILVPAAALVCGAIGFFLRRWELSSAFEAETGLPIPGAPASLVLIGLSAAVAAAMLVLCLGPHSQFPGGYDQAFQAPGSVPYVAAMVLSSFLLLGAGVLLILDLPTAYQEEAAQLALMHSGGSPLLAVLPRALLALLCLLSCPCILSTGQNNYRGEARGKLSLPLLLPGYVGCVWLITAYQRRAADPTQLDYIYELLAIIACLLALYFTAGFSFEKPKAARTVWASAMGIYFSAVTLADGHDLTSLLIYAAFILYLTANLAVLLLNDVKHRYAQPEPEPEPEPEPGPAEGERQPQPEAERMPEEPPITQTEIELEFGLNADDTKGGDDTHV